MLDFLLKNATIIDGSGAPAHTGDVGIAGGKLTFQGLSRNAKTVIDLKGKYLAPGFIDAHSHGDRVLGAEFADLCKLNQGITTEIAGNCGDSVAPVSEAFFSEKM